MRLNARSYPHPVLGNRDDVPGAAFQATLEMTADKQYIYLTADVACSCESLNSLISKGQAVHVLHVECGNTLYRKAFEFRESQYRVPIGLDHLNDVIEANVIVVATDRINGYCIPEAHTDYAGSVFEVNRGDILAIGEGRAFSIISKYDSFRRIGSIMEIGESAKDGDTPMEIQWEYDKILILLSKPDFANYKTLKYNPNALGPLTTTIVLSVLVEALHIFQTDKEKLEDSPRWERVLARRIQDLRLNEDEQPIILAQKILELPIKRALSLALMLANS